MKSKYEKRNHVSFRNMIPYVSKSSAKFLLFSAVFAYLTECFNKGHFVSVV